MYSTLQEYGQVFPTFDKYGFRIPKDPTALYSDYSYAFEKTMQDPDWLKGKSVSQPYKPLAPYTPDTSNLPSINPENISCAYGGTHGDGNKNCPLGTHCMKGVPGSKPGYGMCRRETGGASTQYGDMGCSSLVYDRGPEHSVQKCAVLPCNTGNDCRSGNCLNLGPNVMGYCGRAETYGLTEEDVYHMYSHVNPMYTQMYTSKQLWA
jgi:hypothetical protein